MKTKLNLKEKCKELGQKIKEVDWKKFIGTKAFITVGCLVLVCVSVLIGTLANSNRDAEPVGNEESARVLGNTLLVDNETPADAVADGETGETATDGDFFAMAIINRSQVRDSALEVLRAIADSPDAMPDAKESALTSIAAIADEMSAEANIETLIRAKGIADCVAVISGKTCSIIVNTEGLVPEELTQITEIVYEQAGIPVENITVVEAKRQ